MRWVSWDLVTGVINQATKDHKGSTEGPLGSPGNYTAIIRVTYTYNYV